MGLRWRKCAEARFAIGITTKARCEAGFCFGISFFDGLSAGFELRASGNPNFVTSVKDEYMLVT